MYLSRLILDPRKRQTRAWLANCGTLHRAIMGGFGQAESEQARAEFGVLFRVEFPRDRPPQVLVQSAVPPAWAFETDAIHFEEPIDIDDRLNRIFAAGRARFRLQANPTRRVHARALQGPDLCELTTRGEWKEAPAIVAAERTGIVRRREAEHEKSVGKRVAIRGEEERIAWLKRQGERCGFALGETRLEPVGRPLLDARADIGGVLHGQSRQNRQLTFDTCVFEGLLEVTDEAKLREAIRGGIGPGKAFGCGLLSLAKF